MTDDQKPETIAVRIPSRLDLLAVLDRVTESVCQRLHFDDDTASQVSMSVIEAGTNAIQHGHAKDASKPLDVEFQGVLPVYVFRDDAHGAMTSYNNAKLLLASMVEGKRPGGAM